MTASQILKLLAAKHSEDVFIAECKNGSSGGSFSILDAWVMPRSWAHPALTGYEIKVNRQDFLRDEKWRNYLPMCNYLYFASPPGIISPAELPPEIGLLEASSGGARLHVKRKAVRREIADPVKVFRYVLMCRTQVTRETRSANALAYWQGWLAEKTIDATFGHRLGKSIGKRVTEEIILARHENKQLREKHEDYEGIRRLLREMGLNEDYSSWGFRRKIEAMRSGMTDGERLTIIEAADLMTKFAALIKKDV